VKHQQSGFTLVEIAIVLVIIGLLLGGILKGQEMITQAKIKNVISDFNGISSAQYAYQDRYRALPGDDLQAATRWPTTVACGAAPVLGNGTVDGTYNAAASATVESTCYWQDLRLAGFVAGNGLQQPQNAANGLIGVQTGDGAAGAVMGGAAGAGGFSSLIMCSAGLPDKIAIAVDTQLDDGINNTGSVRAQAQTAPNPNIKAQITGSPGADAYVETGTTTYTMCKAL
jgi:prepilin-type N-terminal cleavage/methylation domain-containing protein